MTEPSKRHPRPGTARERAWDVIRDLGEFTLAEVMVDARIGLKNLDGLVADLEREGFVVRCEGEHRGQAGRFRPVTWRVLKDPGSAFLRGPGGVRAPRARLWQSMKIRRTFRVGDIAATTGVGEESAQHFVRFLVRAGYVEVDREHDVHVGEEATYRLVRNTGPEPPIVLKSRQQIFDPNLDRKSVV